MNDEELKQLWQSSTKNADKLIINPPKIFNEMNTKIKQFEKDVKNRNKREIIVAIVLIPFSLFIAYETPHTLSKIGAIVLLLTSLWITYFLKTKSGIKQETIDNNTSLKEQLQLKKQSISREKQILENIFTWYLLPISTGLILYYAGLGLSNTGGFFRLFVLFIVGIGVYFLNQKAARKW